MDKKDLYNISIFDNNICYSVDMLRLKTYITLETFDKIEFLINSAYKDNIKRFWCSERIMCFHYNYVIEVEEGKSIYFAFMHNTEKIKFDKKDELFNFTIEFNPNKLKNNSLLLFLLNISMKWFIKSYDLAFDININILDIIHDMSGRSFERIECYGGDNKTIYLGKGDGRVKIYNKKKESNIDILSDLTRIEISREINDFSINFINDFKYDGNFPLLYLNQYIYSLSDYNDKTLLAILYAVQNGFDIRNLTKTYKNKIKNLLSGGYKIAFNKDICSDVIKKVIYYYFKDKNIFDFEK